MFRAGDIPSTGAALCSLSGFKDLDIDVSNQVLVESWSEILLLTNAFHSLHSPGVFVMAPNLHLTR